MLILKLLLYVVAGFLSLCMAGIGAMMFAGVPMMDFADEADDGIPAKGGATAPAGQPEPTAEAKKLEPAED